MFISKATQYPSTIVSTEPHKIKGNRKNCRTIDEIPNEPPDRFGQSILHRAAIKHEHKWIRFLSAGSTDADLVEKDALGSSPLHYAAKRQMLSDMVQGKLNLKVLLQTKDAEGNTPLHIMAEIKHFDRTFLPRLTALELDELLQIPNNKGQTVAAIISGNNNLELLQWLINRLPDDSRLRSIYHHK